LRIPVLPNYCGYPDGRYHATRPEILIGPSRLTVNEQTFFAPLRAMITSKSRFQKIVQIRQLYPHFKYTDIASHPALIMCPYQVSVMSFFEFYRMNIPMFFPDHKLLSKWHHELGMLNERTWDRVYGIKTDRSHISKHPAVTIKYDPNDEVNLDGLFSFFLL
jgi:hypothetical protein